MRFFAQAKLEKFDYKDPLKFEGLLTDEEKMIEQSAKQFAQEKLLPRVVKAYKDEHFDVEIMREMGEMGFLVALTLSSSLAEIRTWMRRKKRARSTKVKSMTLDYIPH